MESITNDLRPFEYRPQPQPLRYMVDLGPLKDEILNQLEYLNYPYDDSLEFFQPLVESVFDYLTLDNYQRKFVENVMFDIYEHYKVYGEVREIMITKLIQAFNYCLQIRANLPKLDPDAFPSITPMGGYSYLIEI